MLGLQGFELPKTPTIPNKLEAGILHLGPAELPLAFGSVLNGTITVEATDERITAFSGDLNIKIEGLADGNLKLEA